MHGKERWVKERPKERERKGEKGLVYP